MYKNCSILQKTRIMLRKFFITVLLLSAVAAANAQTGTWSGKLDVQGTKISLVFHLDDDNPTMDSPDEGVTGIPVKLERKGAGGIAVKIPAIGATFEGNWIIKQIVGTFTQMGMSFPLTLTPGENKPKRPQTPKGPFPYSTEEISFNNGDIVLNGTLTLPEGYTEATPALVMVTGSGQQNRDEELFEHKPFAVIADALARAGIATLRYDDRGFSNFTGKIQDCTTEDFKEDALAAVNVLRERFDKVGVIGHSEGGTIALMLAAEQSADFIVSLAGMVVSGAETLLQQNKTALESTGISKEDIDTYCKVIREAFDVIVNGGQMPVIENYDLPEALKQNFLAVLREIQMPYMKRFLSLDMRPLLNSITCPVLALNGTKDVQVDASKNLEALNYGLKNNEMNKLVTVEGVNHLFQHCKTGAVTEYREIEETISPEVLTVITTWLSQFKQRLLRPDEAGVDGFAAIDDDALTCAEAVIYSEEVCPLGDFLSCSPSFKRSLGHNLIPESRIIHYAVVKRSQYSARIKAVAYCTELRHSQGHILSICDHTALACAVLRKFRSGVSAGRTYIEY